MTACKLKHVQHMLMSRCKKNPNVTKYQDTCLHQKGLLRQESYLKTATIYRKKLNMHSFSNVKILKLYNTLIVKFVTFR